MALQELLTLLAKLRERISLHSDLLRQSEAMTRSALVDPLLRALDWNTEDLAQVRPEFNPGRGRADYALWSDGKVVVFLEAKKLDEALDKAVDDGIRDCMHVGAQFFVVTDGRRWHMYNVHKPVALRDKLEVSFDLVSDSVEEASLKSLYLWRPRFVSGSAVTPPTSPTTSSTSTSGVSPQPKPPTPEPKPSGFVPLTELGSVTGKKPLRLRLPDGTEKALRANKDLFSEVCIWLAEKGHVTRDMCPTQLPNELYIETLANANQMKDYSVHLIKKVGQNPEELSVLVRE